MTLNEIEVGSSAIVGAVNGEGRCADICLIWVSHREQPCSCIK